MKHTSLLARAAAATVALSATVAGAVILTAPAQAALKETNYGFQTFAYGSNVTVDQLGVKSDPTGRSYIGCTRLSGKIDNANVAATGVNSALPLALGTVVSHSETFEKPNGDVGSTSNNRIANLSVGAGNIKLVIKGLETSATTWADKSGAFHTSNTYQLADITAQTGIQAVDDLLNVANPTINTLISTLLKLPGDALELTGIGRIELGKKQNNIIASRAEAHTYALRILLYGANRVEGGADDISVVVGRSVAKIYRDLPAGVMSGFGYAADVKLLGGAVGVGQLMKQRLNCAGTNGKVLNKGVAGVDLLNLGAIGIGAVEGRARGIQRADNSINAWTEGRIANVTLGSGANQIEIKGVVAHAEMEKKKDGTLVKSTDGTKVLSITVGGKGYELKDLGDKIEIPGIAVIKFGIVENPAKNRLKVTAIQIQLLPGAAAETGLATVNLGVATVRIKKI